MLLYLSIFGFFIAFLLYYNSRKQFKGNYYLVGVFVLNSLNSLTIYSTYYGQSEYLAAIIHGHFMSVYYLTGPLMFFYVRSLIKDDYRLTRADWWHFIPFIILTLGLIPFLYTPFDQKLELARKVLQDGRILNSNFNVFIPQNVSLFFRWIGYLLYFSYSLYYYWKHKSDSSGLEISSESHRKRLDKWVMILLSTTILICAMLIVLTYWGAVSKDFRATVMGATPIIYLIVIIYIVLNFSLFVFPEILYGYPHFHRSATPGISAEAPVLDRPEVPEEPEDVSELPVKLEDLPEPEDPTAARLKLLTPEYLKHIETKIREILPQKIYLQQDFSMMLLSELTQIPAHHLSYYFNSVLNKRFSDWRNQLRVLHLQGLIKQGRLETMTLSALAEECGFVSQATFIAAFKKETGQTPSGFLKRS